MSVWIEKFILVCKESKNIPKVEQAKNCLGIYSDIEKGFGYFFLHMFTATQFSCIFLLFLAISIIMELEEFIPEKVFTSIGMIILTAGLIVNIVALTLTLDNGFKSLKDITQGLRHQMERVSDVLERQRIQNVINNIKETGPLTGKGFFEITRGTLTSMVSLGITYIIIIVQFKMSLG